LFTAQQAANSYKKDNQDLKPDDRPWLAVLTKSGKFVHYQLSVIDKSSALSAFRNRHLNDTRYLTEEQTVNFKKNSSLTDKLNRTTTKSDYVYPEIRIEKEFKSDFFEQLRQNDTVDATSLDNLEFKEGNFVTLKGKKFLLIRDNQGNFNYFVTRSLKQFLFYGRYPTGETEELQIKDTQQHSQAGFFMLFNNHIAFSRHQSNTYEDQNICLPGLGAVAESNSLS